MLRFPEFTEEWGKCKFGEIATGFDYGMNAAAKPYDGQNKYIRITDIDETSSTYNNEDVVSPDGTLSEDYVVNERDILLARTGASTGKSYLYRKSDGKLYFAGFLIRANVAEHNPYFVFSQLHTHRYWRWVSIMSARSGLPGINSQEYASFPIFTTTLIEENKISTLLSLIDKRIATQNKIIEKLETLIKGIRNYVLNNKLQNTTKKKLGELCTITTGKLDANAMKSEGLYPFFTCAEEVYRIDSFAFDTEALLVSGNGANLGYIHYYKGKFNAYQRTYVLSNFIEDIHYIQIYLEAYLHKRIALEKSTSNTPYIVLATLAEMPIIIPNIKIQKDISNKILILKSKLITEIHIRNCYKDMRQFLLSQMFI